MKSVRYLNIGFVIFLVLCIGTYLVSVPQAAAPFLNAMLMMVVPFILGLYLVRRYKVEWRLFGIGALTFIGSQIIHIPFNSWTLVPVLDNVGLTINSGGTNLVLFALIIGLSSGIFEETARYIVYRRWLEKVNTWREGLMFGAGHGGIEATLTGIFALLGFLQVLSFNSADATNTLPPEEAANALAAIQTYWATPWLAHFLPVAERISAIIFHLSAALLVMRAARRDSPLWYLAAVLFHAVFNAVALITAQTWGIYAAEGMIAVMGLLSLKLIFLLRDSQTQGEIKIASVAKRPPELLKTETPPINEKLEDSRYD